MKKKIENDVMNDRVFGHLSAENVEVEGVAEGIASDSKIEPKKADNGSDNCSKFDDNDIFLTLKGYLGRIVSPEKFKKMVHIASNANECFDKKYKINSDGHLVAPNSFWKSVESVANDQIKNEFGERKIGFHNGGY